MGILVNRKHWAAHLETCFLLCLHTTSTWSAYSVPPSAECFPAVDWVSPNKQLGYFQSHWMTAFKKTCHVHYSGLFSYIHILVFTFLIIYYCTKIKSCCPLLAKEVNKDLSQRGRERERQRFRKITFPVYSLGLCAVHKGFVFSAINYVSRKRFKCFSMKLNKY